MSCLQFVEHRWKIYSLNSYATVMNFIPYTLEDVLYS